MLLDCQLGWCLSLPGNVDPKVDAAGEDARATSDAWRKPKHLRAKVFGGQGEA
jgi:hypothetical protein